MSQSLANIIVHLVFSTKERRPLLREEERGQLHAYMTGILRNHDSPLIEINSVRDHVHILFAQSKNHAPARIVEQVKSSSLVGSKHRIPGMLISRGRPATENSASVVRTSKWFANISAGNRSIMRRKISRPNTGDFAKRTANHWTNDVHGIERDVVSSQFVLPLQGGDNLFGRVSWASTAFQPRLSHSGPSALPTRAPDRQIISVSTAETG